MEIMRGCKPFSGKLSMLVLVFGFIVTHAAVVTAAPQYSMTCSSCHQMPPLDSANTKKNPANGAIPGNHLVHATTSVNSCAKCHSVTGSNANDVTTYDTSHRNKVIELSDSLGYGRKTVGVFMNQTSLPPNPLGTCSAASCHSNGKGVHRTTPAWGSLASADCNTCHDAAPSTNAHTTHVSASLGYSFSCDKCHANHVTFEHATSAGRAIDVHFSTAPNIGGTFSAGSCNNLYCHSNGQVGVAKVPVSVAWTDTAPGCAGCHGNATSGTLSGKHASHVNNASILGSNFGCVDCHSATVSNNSTISDKAKHVNSTIDVAGTRVGTVTAGTTCATSSCHSDGKGTPKSVTWTQAAGLGCDGCHGTAASFGSPAYTSGGAGAVDANSHAKHATSAATCANCHSKTTTTGLAIIAGSQHINGFINFTSGNGVTFGKQANKNCSNISCHSGNGIVANIPNAQWGATLSCAGCHNVPTSSVGGSHAQHLLKAGITCEDCHTATASGSTAIKAGAPHVNGTVNVGGGIVTSYNPTKNCATVCHNGTSPIWGNPGSTAVCGTCHSVGPNFATNFSQYYADDQALHNVHFGGTYGPNITIGATASGCASCHTFTDMYAATHDNLQINLDGTKVTNITVGSTTLAKANSGLTAQCSTCHTQSTAWKSSASNGRLACESCHNTATPSVISGKTALDKPLAATNGHGKVGIAQSCSVCHNSNSQHIGVAGGTKRLSDAYSSTTSGRGCNTCHDDAAKVPTAAKRDMKVHQLSGIGSKCADCHDPHGTSNSMMVKATINGAAVSYTGKTTFANDSQTGVCQTCHSTTQHFTKAGVTPPSAHVASTIDCTTCHKHNPTDGSLAFTPNGGCDVCHGYPPAPRKVAGGADFTAFGTAGQWESAKFEDYSGGGGAHIVGAHIPATAKASDGWQHCTPCHPNGGTSGAASHARVLPIRDHVENVTVTINPQLRFSNDTFATYTTEKLVSGGANKSGSCFNVSCHFATTLKWSTER